MFPFESKGRKEPTSQLKQPGRRISLLLMGASVSLFILLRLSPDEMVPTHVGKRNLPTHPTDSNVNRTQKRPRRHAD